MEFSNLFFIYLFLPISLVVYFLMPSMRAKNIALITISLLFYGMGQPCYLPLLIGAVYLNYWLSWRILSGERKTVVIPVVLNLLLLGVFKYLDFLLGIFGIVGADGGGALGWALPIGISYFTFQLISYQVDVYRGKTMPAKSFANLLLYVSMFPKMVMGPIVRYEQVEKQLDTRRTNPRMIFDGAIRFVVGLSKKVLIADQTYNIYLQLTKLEFGGAAWLGALMFTFYIYFEFSGVCDMAIGMGKIFGFRYPENFNLPYTSRSITEFWRRWHMTLGSFFRDYVYIPLGGNRNGKARQVFNMAVVWALTGLWHGASWNYILWGLYFFGLLTAEKQLLPALEKIPYIFRNLITMFFVMIGWVLFANPKLGDMGNTLLMMFGKGKFWGDQVSVIFRNSLPLILLCFIGCTPIPRWISSIWRGILVPKKRSTAFSVPQTIHAVSLFVFAMVLLFYCTACLSGSTSVPSLYASL